MTLVLFFSSSIAIPSQVPTDLGAKLYTALVGMLVAFPVCIFLALSMKERGKEVPRWTSAAIVGSFAVILACIPVGIGAQAYFRFATLNNIATIPDSASGWSIVRALGDAPDQAVKGFNFARVEYPLSWAVGRTVTFTAIIDRTPTRVYQRRYVVPLLPNVDDWVRARAGSGGGAFNNSLSAFLVAVTENRLQVRRET